MKKNLSTILLVFVLILFSNGSLTAQGTLTAGTMIVIKPEKNWNSRDKNPPNFIVAYPVKDNEGNVVINGGTPVELSADWKKNKGVGKPGSVDISFTSVRSVNGEMIPINGSYSEEGEAKKGKAHGLTWGLFFTVLGPFSLPCLAIKGEPAEIRQSTNINTYVVNDTNF